MTLIDFKYFLQITPKELCHQSWNKENAKDVAPAIINMIDRFNTISYWVATEIVNCANDRKRTALIKRFIEVAEVFFC